MEYSARVRELFATLPRCGELAPGSGDHRAGEAMDLSRGAWVRFEARLAEGRIADCAFRAWGCPHTLAAAALAANRLVGRDADDVPIGEAQALATALAAPPEKLGRLLMVEDAVLALFRNVAALQSATRNASSR